MMVQLPVVGGIPSSGVASTNNSYSNQEPVLTSTSWGPGFPQSNPINSPFTHEETEAGTEKLCPLARGHS